MVFKRKIISSVIALSMIFSAASALVFTETAQAAIPAGVAWNQIYFQDFEDGGNKPEFTKSGTSSAWASDGDYGHSFTNADQYDLGDYSLQIKQRSNITTKATMKTDPADSDTPINGKVPAEKLGKVKISFNIAKLYEAGTATRISIVGDDSNGDKQEQNNILTIKRYGLSYTANGYSAGDWSNSTWHKVDIYVDCENGVYDVVYDGSTILSDIELYYDFTSIYGVNFNADKGSSTATSGNYYTYLDNISFSVIADTYSVTLNTNGGTINAGNITSYTETVGATLPTNVTKANATFGGWYDNSSFTGSPVTTIPTNATGNKTFYAKWIDFPSVTLNTNGGTINAGNITCYEEGVGATLPTNVTRADYTFAGWYAESDCSGSAVTSISSSETGNKVFYAKWIPNGTWDKVFSQDFESGSNWDTYFSEPDGSGTRNVPSDINYTNNTGDDLGARVKRIASKKSNSRTLALNEAVSPLYDGNAYAGKADIVKISLDIAMEAVDKTAHIRLVGKSNGSRTQTGTSAGNRFIIMTKSGSYTKFLYHDSNPEYYYDGACRREDSMHVNAETWYKVTAIVNCITDTYDVYINGTLRESGMKLDVDFDTIYGIEVVATYNSDSSSDWTGTFVDNVRYYVPGSVAAISSASYYAGTLSATVVANSNTHHSNKVIVAAYSAADEANLLGIAIADVVADQNAYTVNIIDLTSKPHHIKALVWDFDDYSPSAEFVTRNID